MTPTSDTSIPKSWHGFENFIPVESTQGIVLRGTDAQGTIAYLKRHRSVASFERELRALQLIEGYDVGPKVLAVHLTDRLILTACAGVAFEAHRACAETSKQCVDTLSRLHRCPTPADEIPLGKALLMRWSRLHRRLGDHCSKELTAWMRDRLKVLPEVPRTIVHRDLRPSHWCFDGGTARLIDFGQARVDAVLFDAVPFYTQQYPDIISDRVCAYFEAEYGQHVMANVDLFVALYLCGTIERLIYHDDECERERARQLCVSLNQWSSAPIEFRELIAEKEGKSE